MFSQWGASGSNTAAHIGIESHVGLIYLSTASSSKHHGLQQPYIVTMRLWQNGHHFPDDIFKCIFLTKKVEFSFRFVANGPINNKSALVQKMSWYQPGDKPLSEPIMIYHTAGYMCHLASMS